MWVICKINGMWVMYDLGMWLYVLERVIYKECGLYVRSWNVGYM